MRGGVRVICRIRPFVEDDARGTQNWWLGRPTWSHFVPTIVISGGSKHVANTMLVPGTSSKDSRCFCLFCKLCRGTCALHPCLMCLIRSKGRLAWFVFYWRMSKIPVTGTVDFEDMEEGIRPTVEQAWSRMRISHGRASPLGQFPLDLPAIWAGKNRKFGECLGAPVPLFRKKNSRISEPCIKAASLEIKLTSGGFGFVFFQDLAGPFLILDISTLCQRHHWLRGSLYRSGGLLYLEALHQQDESVGDPAIGWGSKYVKICEKEVHKKRFLT